MHYTPITSFRRAYSVAQAERITAARNTPETCKIDKWQVLRNLGLVRREFGLNDRDLSVLQALLSFHPGNELQPGSDTIVVHPSNRITMMSSQSAATHVSCRS